MTEMFYWTAADGQVLALEAPFILTELRGAGTPPADVQMQKAPFQDGKTHVDQLFDERTVTLQVAIVASSRAELMTLRGRLGSAFNPKLGLGRLTWRQPDDTEYYLDCVPAGCEFPGGEAAGASFQVAEITLIAGMPFWYRAEVIEASQLSGGLVFPFEFPFQLATIKTASIATNKGDVPTPITLTFVGPATSPRVSNVTTGKHLKVIYTLRLGQSIRINTAFGEKEVTLIDVDGTESNVMNWLTADSEFFELIPGDNSLSYSEEGGNAMAMALVQWRNRYVGR